MKAYTGSGFLSALPSGGRRCPMASFGGINNETRRDFFESLPHDGDMNTSADIELRGAGREALIAMLSKRLAARKLNRPAVSIFANGTQGGEWGQHRIKRCQGPA
jgi:hypothetical protein